jgi:hypothetical protein
MTTLEKVTLALLGVIMLTLTAAYVYGVSTQWEMMKARPVRIAYFVGDLTVLYPLAIVAFIGMIRRRPWGRRFMYMTIGALLFDTAHQVYYLFGDNYFGASHLVKVLLLAVIIAFSIFAYYALTQPAERTE